MPVSWPDGGAWLLATTSADVDRQPAAAVRTTALVFGADAPPGVLLRRELATWVQAVVGVPRPDAAVPGWIRLCTPAWADRRPAPHRPRRSPCPHPHRPAAGASELTARTDRAGATPADPLPTLRLPPGATPVRKPPATTSVTALLEQIATALETGRPFANRYRPEVTKEGFLDRASSRVSRC